MNADTSLLTLENVACGYNGAVVLEGVNLQVAPSEMWFLLGANGAGKTTLLKAMLGLHAPINGRILMPRDGSRSTQIGFVPQHTIVNRSLPSSVREFVELGFLGLRLSRQEKREKLHRCLEAVGLENHEKHDIRMLSGGTLRRVVLARALIRDPNLLMLDEPTNHLDSAAKNDFLDLLAALHRDRKLSVVFVTHDVAIALRLATHVGLLHEGRVSCGTRDEILTDNGLRSLYRNVAGSDE